jgi:hypothetical protein
MLIWSRLEAVLSATTMWRIPQLTRMNY